MNPEQIETEYFDPDYKELSNKDRLGTVEGELLRIQDELEELKKNREIWNIYTTI